MPTYSEIQDKLDKLPVHTSELLRKEKLTKPEVEGFEKHADAITKAVEALVKALKEGANKLEKDDPVARAEGRASISALMAAVKATTLSDFFSDVSTSMIETQKALNDQSLAYIKGLAALDVPIPPSFFAIPSVRADMKVGFSQTKGGGINLVLFSSKSQREDFGESTVHFDLVAAPPPPGQFQFGEYLTPMPGVFVLGAEKKSLLDKVLELAEIDDADKVFYNNGSELAIILRHVKAERNRPHYLVLWPVMSNSPQRPDSWKELSVFDLNTDERGSLFLDTGIFENDDPLGGKFLNISTKSKLPTGNNLQSFAIDLGDVLMRITMLWNDWRQSMKVRQAQAPPQND
jgi:hypothetical protein